MHNSHYKKLMDDYRRTGVAMLSHKSALEKCRGDLARADGDIDLCGG